MLQVIETLLELNFIFSETMLCEFVDKECFGNRNITEHLKDRHYTPEQIEVLRAVVKMDSEKNGW